jgi:hypothetical protein
MREKYKNIRRLCDSKKQEIDDGQKTKNPQRETPKTDELNKPPQQFPVSEIPSTQTTLLDLKASDESCSSEGASL